MVTKPHLKIVRLTTPFSDRLWLSFFEFHGTPQNQTRMPLTQRGGLLFLTVWSNGDGHHSLGNFQANLADKFQRQPANTRHKQSFIFLTFTWQDPGLQPKGRSYKNSPSNRRAPSCEELVKGLCRNPFWCSQRPARVVCGRVGRGAGDFTQASCGLVRFAQGSQEKPVPSQVLL